MCIRSLRVEIEMMSIQQDSGKKGLASGLKECKGNERTVPSWGKSPKIGRIRAMYREKERLHNLRKDHGGAIYLSFVIYI